MPTAPRRRARSTARSTACSTPVQRPFNGPINGLFNGPINGLINGPINGESFTAWVKQALVPTLSAGDIVVLDNLGSHKGKAVRAAIRNAGAHRRFLPPCSPDLNPIEQLFAKLKHVLREAAEHTIDTVAAALADIFDRFTPQECANYITNAGYASS